MTDENNNMGNIKKNKDFDERAEAMDIEEIYQFRRRGRQRRSEDIPIDDFLLDDTLDDSAPQNTAPDEDDTYADDLPYDELPEDEELPPEEEEEVPPKDDLPRLEVDAEALFANVPKMEKIRTRKSRNLRKAFGVDDDFVTCRGKKKKKNTAKMIYDPARTAKFLKFIVVMVASVLGAYGVMFLAVNLINRSYYSEISERLMLSAPIAESILQEQNFFYYIDSDMDGLTDDFEARTFRTDPDNKDTDGDGQTDGEEFLGGSDPLDPGNKSAAPANYRAVNLRSAKLSVGGDPAERGKTTFTEYASSLEAYSGVVGKLYEILHPSGDTTLTVQLTDIPAGYTGPYGIFRLDTDDFTVTELPSVSDGSSVSAEIKENGVYFAAEKTKFSMDAGVEVLFVIDNSGSLYPSSTVAGSEENDVDFKRLDFSEKLIDSFSDETSCGISKFTASYTLLSEITSDKKAVKGALKSIKNGRENFDGTNIAGAVIEAAAAFGNDSSRKVIVLITDGLPSEEAFRVPEQSSIDICRAGNISVVSVSLGKHTDTVYLSKIAEDTGGMFFRALNADSFDIIVSKINDYIYNSRATLSSADGGSIKVSTLADTGFTRADCTLAAGVPTSLNFSGSLIGSAILNREYYSRDIPLKGPDYDLSADKFFIEGKKNLGTYYMPSVNVYNEYLGLKDKWNFSSAGSVLTLSGRTNNWLADKPLSVFEAEFSEGVKQSDAMLALRWLTFQTLNNYSTYEKAAIDVEELPENEQQIFRLINSFENSEYELYSFGSQGDSAYALLYGELSSGTPSVLVTLDGTVLNATKLSRSTRSSGELVIEAYDLRDTSKTKLIYFFKRDIFNPGSINSQYTAKIDGKETGLYILKSNLK